LSQNGYGRSASIVFSCTCRGRNFPIFSQCCLRVPLRNLVPPAQLREDTIRTSTSTGQTCIRRALVDFTIRVLGTVGSGTSAHVHLPDAFADSSALMNPSSFFPPLYRRPPMAREKPAFSNSAAVASSNERSVESNVIFPFHAV